MNKPFPWFPEEVANARCETDKVLLMKQLGDIVKLLGSSFCREMAENLDRYKSANFAHYKWVVVMVLTSPFLGSLVEISGVYKIMEFKGTDMIKRSYQCYISVYQLAKL